jgi:hypothetical protein
VDSFEFLDSNGSQSDGNPAKVTGCYDRDIAKSKSTVHSDSPPIIRIATGIILGSPIAIGTLPAN